MEMPKGLSPLYYNEYLSSKDVDKKRIEKASELGWVDIRLVHIDSRGSTGGGCEPWDKPNLVGKKIQ